MADTAPFVLGLTGNIGSGKSTLADLWVPFGCVRIDGDTLGRRVVDESAEFRDWLRFRFGDDVFNGDTLLRAELGRIVFTDSTARDDLNAAIWPPIRRLLAVEIESAIASGRIALVNAAMIFEWGDQERYDVLVAVVVDPETGARRAADRMNRSVDEMMQRYKMQLPAEQKAEAADFVIHNDGSLTRLRETASALWPEIVELGTRRAMQRT